MPASKTRLPCFLGSSLLGSETEWTESAHHYVLAGQDLFRRGRGELSARFKSNERARVGWTSWFLEDMTSIDGLLWVDVACGWFGF